MFLSSKSWRCFRQNKYLAFMFSLILTNPTKILLLVASAFSGWRWTKNTVNIVFLFQIIKSEVHFLETKNLQEPELTSLGENEIDCGHPFPMLLLKAFACKNYLIWVRRRIYFFFNFIKFLFFYLALNSGMAPTCFISYTYSSVASELENFYHFW